MNKTPVKSTLLSPDKNILSRDRVSCRVGVTLCCDFYTFRSCNTCTFSLTTFAVLRHTTLILWNSLIYTILKQCKWRHKLSQSSQRILACGSYSPYKIWLGLWRHFYGFKIYTIFRLFHRISVNFIIVWLEIATKKSSPNRVKIIFSLETHSRLCFLTLPFQGDKTENSTISRFKNCNADLSTNSHINAVFLFQSTLLDSLYRNMDCLHQATSLICIK